VKANYFEFAHLFLSMRDILKPFLVDGRVEVETEAGAM
jgi:hypothetical protein